MQTWLKIDRWIEKLQTWICIVLFSAILVMGTIQIVARYLSTVSVPWTEELMRFCMIWLTMVGSALTVRVDGHVSVDIVLTYMKSHRRKAILFVMARLICVFFLIVYFPSAIQLIMRSATSRAVSLPIPYGYVYAAVPVGIVMMLLSYLTTIPRMAKEYAKGER